MKHTWTAQRLPLKDNVVECGRCKKAVKIGQWPTGRRRKCIGHTPQQRVKFEVRRKKRYAKLRIWV